jgi:hypothetical protein
MPSLSGEDSTVSEPTPTSTTEAAPAPEDVKLTPETSDVPPKYMAFVSPDDHSAVMDLIALVPETKQTTTLTVYKRKDQKWVQDDQALMDLQSATPPPVVPLKDKSVLNDVLAQVDKIEAVHASALPFDMDAHMVAFWGGSIEASMVAAGGLDRNRGKAEQLREYWVHGEGAAKVRWGTPGDWARCVRHLEKYLGERAKGYCQLRHKEAMGVYTATHAKEDRNHG